MRGILRKLSPTRSPVVALILLVVGVPLWIRSPRLWERLLHLEWPAAVNASLIGLTITVLAAIVLYGLTPRFRTSTSRVGVRLPRCVLVFYWIASWVVLVLDLGLIRARLPMALHAGAAGSGTHLSSRGGISPNRR